MSPQTRDLIGLLADYAQILSVVVPALYFSHRFFKKTPANRLIGPFLRQFKRTRAERSRPGFDSGLISLGLSQPAFSKETASKSTGARLSGSYGRSIAVRANAFFRKSISVCQEPQPSGSNALSLGNVAIIGLGGVGSSVGEQLARLGVQQFTLAPAGPFKKNYSE